MPKHIPPTDREHFNENGEIHFPDGSRASRHVTLQADPRFTELGRRRYVQKKLDNAKAHYEYNVLRCKQCQRKRDLKDALEHHRGQVKQLEAEIESLHNQLDDLTPDESSFDATLRRRLEERFTLLTDAQFSLHEFLAIRRERPGVVCDVVLERKRAEVQQHQNMLALELERCRSIAGLRGLPKGLEELEACGMWPV